MWCTSSKLEEIGRSKKKTNQFAREQKSYELPAGMSSVMVTGAEDTSALRAPEETPTTGGLTEETAMKKNIEYENSTEIRALASGRELWGGNWRTVEVVC